MARYKDPYAQLGEFDEDTPEKARKRAKRIYDEEVAVRAQWILDNDPDVLTMKDARKKAREELEEIAQVNKGLLDPNSGELTKKGRTVLKESRETTPPDRSRTRRSSSRPGRRSKPVGAKAARAVVRPFGDAASAGWTFFQWGLSLVLLFVVLRDAEILEDVTRGVTSGLKRLSDPGIPLIPSKGELRKAGGKRSPRPTPHRLSRGGRPIRSPIGGPQR